MQETLTDSRGRPFVRPTRPALFAPIEEKIAYLRALSAYHDAIRDCAADAFDRSFREAVR